MNKIWVNVEGAIYKDCKWLMIERSKKEPHASGTTSMVGGTLEFEKDMKNSLEENLKREIIEEVGIEIENEMKYVESKSFATDNNHEVLDIVFLCKYKDGEAKVKSDEIANVFWLTTEEIMTHPNTPPWIKQSIKLAGELLNKH